MAIIDDAIGLISQTLVIDETNNPCGAKVNIVLTKVTCIDKYCDKT